VGQIHLANSKRRNAMVTTETVAGALEVRWVDGQNQQARPVRLLRGTLAHDLPAIARAAGGADQVAAALIAGDPEVDLETYGAILGPVSRVYLDPDGAMVTHVDEVEIVRNPDGSEKERRARRPTVANTASEQPLRWSGRLLRKADVYNRFIFAMKLQVTHVNGLTYDFLYGMAQELEAAESLLLLGGGPKSSDPLVFHRGGTPYRGFLEGRTQGERYCLVLHLSNLELRRP
jgi:hypothetical protein